MRVLAAAAVLLLVAGCLGTGPQRPDYAEIESEVLQGIERILVQDHDHFDAGLHGGAANLELVGYHNGFDDSGDPNRIPAGGFYTELAVNDRYVFLSRFSADGSYGGFSIISIQDPANPTISGHFPGLGGADVEVSDDGRLVFFATQRNTPEQILGHLIGSMEATAPRGITVVDVGDPANPATAGFLPLPANGPHTITYFHHPFDGEEYLVICTYDLITDPGTGAILSAVPVTQRVLIAQIHRSGGSPERVALEPVGQYQVTETPRGGKLFFPHDAIPQLHPFEDRLLLYVAYWDKGVQILDITDPRLPQHVSGYTEFSPSSRTNIHQVRPFDEAIAGRHVTVTEPEIINADETGYIFFLDTSDPRRPAKLGHWTLPGDLIVQNLDFSPHNFDTFDGKVALAHNHAGLWIIDVSDEENLREPKTVGYYMPAKPRDDSPRPQPYVWGVFEHEVPGHGSLLFASDEATGLHILRYTGP